MGIDSCAARDAWADQGQGSDSLRFRSRLHQPTQRILYPAAYQALNRVGSSTDRRMRKPWGGFH
jgi:hypothetical protein